VATNNEIEIKKRVQILASQLPVTEALEKILKDRENNLLSFNCAQASVGDGVSCHLPKMTAIPARHPQSHAQSHLLSQSTLNPFVTPSTSPLSNGQILISPTILAQLLL
jgi:hypothetical protein